MNFYCTLFDSGYLSRGLLLHASLMKHSPDSYLYIVAFDDLSFVELQKMNLINSRIISLKEFEDSALLSIKESRTKGEYCWTCTPSVIKYCLEKFNLQSCTYLDADLFFFSDPFPLVQEAKDFSILITEHHYTNQYNQSKMSGKYCVQFMFFKNNEEGMIALNWWRDRCIEWCFAKAEDGKFGDQKYLDDWMIRFKGVHELANLGGGVAPWNVQQYDFFIKNHQIFLRVKESNKEYPLIFYHFHALKIYDDFYDLGLYKLKKDAIALVYKKYIMALEEVDLRLRSLDVVFNWHAKCNWDQSARGVISRLKRRLQGNLNIFKKESFSE